MALHFASSLPSSLLHLGLGPVLLTHLPRADPLPGDTQVSGRPDPQCRSGEEVSVLWAYKTPDSEGLWGKAWG